MFDAKSGAVRTLLKPPLQLASPRWSGDGKRIAYIGGLMSDETITGGDLYVIGKDGGEPYDPDVYARSSPINFIKNVRAPTLLLSGDRDSEVPITQSYKYWNALRRLGVPTRFVVYPDEGHFFFKRPEQLDAMSRVVDWFDTYMKLGSGK